MGILKKIVSLVKEEMKIKTKMNIRKKFAETLNRGKIDVVWVDVDGMVYGWTMSADEELNLVKVASLIAITKQKKLIHILNAKGDTDESY